MTPAAGFSGTLVAWSLGLLVAGVPQQPPQRLPHSALPLELLGVMVETAAPSRSSCLIRCTYGVEKLGSFPVGPGDNACDLAEVREIREDGVVINNLLTNRLEILPFRKGKPSTAVPPQTKAPVPANTQPPTDAPPLPPVHVLTTSPGLVTVELPKDAVEHYLDNLPALLDSALAIPRYRETGNGQRTIEGFEIGRIREASVVEQVGLKNGDVILQLNGQKLDSLAAVVQLLGQARTMPQVKLTVLRNGQTMTFVFNRK
jgi:hypothetical protein